MTKNVISPQWANRPVYCITLLILGLGNIISYSIHVSVFHGTGPTFVNVFLLVAFYFLGTSTNFLRNAVLFEKGMCH